MRKCTNYYIFYELKKKSMHEEKSLEFVYDFEVPL